MAARWRALLLAPVLLALYILRVRYLARTPSCSCAEWRPCSTSSSLRNRPRCAASGGGRHVLIVHEQHPQPLGCDRRLLSLVSLLKAEGWKVSLFYRRHVREEQQSPRTAELAAQLGIPGPFDAASYLDSGCLHPPPALYKFAGRGRQLARLASQGWFDLVLVSVWFWNEPQPAFAEIALPLLRSYAPANRRPYVGLLVDDAHALRAGRLAVWETDARVRAAYESQAVALAPRLRSLYGAADAVMHVSPEDQLEERRAFGGALRELQWHLLRTPLKAMRATHAPIRKRASPPNRLLLGFLGNGQTATNHQGVQWFLSHCWAKLRAAHPSVRLRLVGRPPGVIYNTSGVYQCARRTTTAVAASANRAPLDSESAVPRCGWAWGTRYAGVEAHHGIDEVGFLPSDAMVKEVLSWRAMVAPIRATTGINTKLLVALELGVPLVVTSAAAAPLALGAVVSSTGRSLSAAHAANSVAHTANAARAKGNATATRLAAVAAAAPSAAALLADEPAAFVAHCARLLGSEHVWRASSRAGLDAYERMVEHDPAAEDMRTVLRSACASNGADALATPETDASTPVVDVSIFDFSKPKVPNGRVLEQRSLPPRDLDSAIAREASLCDVVDSVAASSCAAPRSSPTYGFLGARST